MFSFNQLQNIVTIRYRTLFFIILPLMYFVGIIGLQVPSVQGFFKFFSSINLWVSLGLIWMFQEQKNNAFYLFAAVTFLVGYWIEVLGVHTGLIFGVYWYGDTLGVQCLKVPLVLGANWLILVYGAVVLMARYLPLKGIKTTWIRAVIQSGIGAALLVLLDILIEPVAIHFDFWHWQSEIVPLQNYIAWFVIAFVLVYLGCVSTFTKSNPMALLILVLQGCFFVGHTLLFQLL